MKTIVLMCSERLSDLELREIPLIFLKMNNKIKNGEIWGKN